MIYSTRPQNGWGIYIRREMIRNDHEHIQRFAHLAGEKSPPEPPEHQPAPVPLHQPAPVPLPLAHYPCHCPHPIPPLLYSPPTPPTSRPARSTRSCLSSRCAARVCCACRRCQTSSTRWGVRSSRGRHWRCATGRVSGAAQCQSHRPRRGMCTMTCFGIWSRTRISIAGGGIRRGRSHSGLERGEIYIYKYYVYKYTYYTSNTNVDKY